MKILLSLTAILFLIVALFPYLYSIIGFVLMATALLNIIDGGSSIGALLYAAGIAILLRAGAFRQSPTLKLTVSAIIFVGILFTQTRISFYFFLRSLFDIILIVILCFIIFLLFKDNLKQYLMKKPVCHMADYGLTELEQECIRQSMQNIPFKAIAISQHVSISVIKQTMAGLYKKFGVSDKTDFLRFLDGYTIVYSDETDEYGKVSRKKEKQPAAGAHLKRDTSKRKQ